MDKCLEIVGNNGKFQKNIIYICFLSSLLTTFYTIIISFLKQPDFFVTDKKNPNEKPIRMPYSKEICDRSKYEIKKDIKSIHNWIYEFDLYCEREYLNILITYSILISLLLATVFLTPIPDKYGRKSIFKFFIALSLIVHINLMLVINPFHIIISTFIGCFTAFSYYMGFYIIVEFIRSDLTGSVLGVFNAAYPLFGIFLGFFFLTINNCRILFLITTFLSIILVYLTFNYFIESPRWLYSMGRKKECLEVLTFIAKVNEKENEWNDFQKNNPDIINEFEELKDENSQIKNYSIIEILRFPSQRKKIMLLCCLWFISGMNFFGILLNLGRMKGDFFMNSILSFSGEMISELGSGYLADIKGRIWVMKYSSYLGSISFLIYKFVGKNLDSFFIMGSMFGFAAVYNVLGIYVPENFPVFIRGNVTGFLIIIMRFAPMLVPFLTNILGQNVDYVFIILGFFAGFILNFLDETFGKPIIENIPEEEDNNLKNKFLQIREGKRIKVIDAMFIRRLSSGSISVK